MCTAISFKTNSSYFGRTLDLDKSYGEKVVITPRNFPLKFRKKDTLENHFAIIGMATVVNNYPLYFDATNEKGVSMAGLNFPHNAHYFEFRWEKDNITPFEFIPYILAQANDVTQALNLLENINLVNIPFSEDFPLSPLHWMISDKEKSVTVECVKNGIKIYENKVGILTNNPPFDIQMFNLNNYINLTNEVPQNRFLKDFDFDIYCNGMGSIGLPGDYSSMSRFVKVCFIKENSYCEEDENSSISQFFHIMDSVSQVRGATKMLSGGFDTTLYTSCCNTDKGIYYYKTYENNQISAVNMYKEDLNLNTLISYPLVNSQQIKHMN